MTNQHPITPPPELVSDLWAIYHRASVDDVRSAWTASVNAAFHAGADQELEACCEWLHWQNLATHRDLIPSLRAAMRPQPPLSDKEQALANVRALLSDASRALLPDEREALELSRRALEQLPDDPAKSQPSLKEQALAELQALCDTNDTSFSSLATIRAALEQLP